MSSPSQVYCSGISFPELNAVLLNCIFGMRVGAGGAGDAVADGVGASDALGVGECAGEAVEVGEGMGVGVGVGFGPQPPKSIARIITVRNHEAGFFTCSLENRK